MKVTYQPAPIKETENNNVELDFPLFDSESLPTVSVVTLANNAKFVSSMLFCWFRYTYSPKKLEWIIVENNADIENYLPDNDDRIHYYRTPEKDKLNYAISQAKNEYIIHMYENCYYFPDSILAKVTVMKKGDRKGVLNWSHVVYNPENNFAMSYRMPQVNILNDVLLSGIAYEKKYWENRGKNVYSENFIGKKYGDWMDIYFNFSNIYLDYYGALETYDYNLIENTDSVKNLFHEKFIPVMQNINELLKG